MADEKPTLTVLRTDAEQFRDELNEQAIVFATTKENGTFFTGTDDHARRLGLFEIARHRLLKKCEGDL